MHFPLISVIVPTLNEEKSLPRVMESIHKYLSPKYTYETIIVDNGSTDKTISIAKNYNATVIVKPFVTIATLRNIGVQHGIGTILVFLDADVILTDTWYKNFPDTVRLLSEHPFIVTGSRCGIGYPGSWIEYFWFLPLLKEDANYINSGHLITTRALFERLGGFCDKLETNEDYDFSMRARLSNAKIINNPNLYVIHEGYPKTLGSFIKREFWHGKSSYESIKSILHSKTSTLAILFVLSHIIALIGLAVSHKKSILIGSSLIFFICLGASAIKFRYNFTKIIVNSFLYYCYFTGRGLAFLNSLFKSQK